MQIYIIDVFESSGTPLQVLTIFPGALKTADGNVFRTMIVNTKTKTGVLQAYLNAWSLVNLATGKPYGELIGFNFNLSVGSEFSILYTNTGITYPAKLRDNPTVPDPQPSAPQQNPRSNTQINPAQQQLEQYMNQQMIDYLNSINNSNF